MIDLTITLSDPQLTDEQLQERTETLINALIGDRLVENAYLIPINDAPEGAKSIGGFVTGGLSAIAEITKLKPIIEGLGNQLFGSEIEIEVEKQLLRGKKLKIKIQRPEDLEKIMPEIEKFMK